MPTLAAHSTCSGCAACYSACSKGAISMEMDPEGFLRPTISEQQCIDCGACEKVCHVLNPYKTRRPLEVYAARSEDNIRSHCSSGGIFPLFAEYMVKQGGLVWGVVWNMKDKIPTAEFKCCDIPKDLQHFQGSKYVQAKIGNTFKEIKHQLKNDKNVLFSGTPCQIAGLKHFLNKEYDNLICVEVVCHGVPSPEVFRNYLLEILNSKSLNISYINFREKLAFGYGWRNFGFVIKENVSDTSSKYLLSQNVIENPYLRAFLSELCNRPSCHNCHSRQLRSGADITIGDFWKLSEFLPEFDDDLGTSLVLVNTPKGHSLFKDIEQRLTCKEQITYEIAIDSTGALIESPPMHPKRELFFKEYKSKGVEKTVIKILGPHFWKRLWFRLLDIQYNIKHKFY